MQNNEQNILKKEIIGIGGWLVLFLFSIFLFAINLFSEFKKFSEVGSFFQLWPSYLYNILAISFVIYTSICLIIRKKNAISLAIMYLFFFLFINIWGWLITTADGIINHNQSAFNFILSTFFYFIIWLIYLINSKRIINTWPENFRKMKIIDVILFIMLIILPIIMRIQAVNN